MLFLVDKKLVSTSQNDRLAEKYVQLNYEVFHWRQFTVVWKNERKWVSLARKSVTVKTSSFFYNWLPLVLVMVSSMRKNLDQKRNGFHLLENWFAPARMNVFVEIVVSIRRKKLPLSLNYSYDFQ